MNYRNSRIKTWGLRITPALAAIAVLGAGCTDDGSIGPPAPGPNPNASYRIAYGTFLGGSDTEEIREPTLLSGGRLLFGERAKSAGLPTTAGAVQSDLAGGSGDSYLGILSADGSQLEAATYFGGTGMERPPYGIAVAGNGDIVFGSGTTSADIPTSGSSFRSSLHSPVPDPGDGYVCRISGDLTTLRWCTYTGGGWMRGGLTLDANENVLVAGRVTGTNFPTTSGAFQQASRGQDDAFLMKLNSTGTALIFSTKIGGSGSAVGEVALSVRVHPSDGSLYIGGNSTSADFPGASGANPKDPFIAKFDANGSTLQMSTVFGGNGDSEGCEHRLLLEADGSVLCSGSTNSTNFPATHGSTNGDRQAHVTRLTPSGAIAFSHLIGGSGDEHVLMPVRDSQGNIWVGGRTTSRDLQVTPDAVQPTFGGGVDDGVVFALSPDGSEIVYASYLGGSDTDLIRGLTIGPDDSVYLVGRTDSPDFPVTPGALQTSHGGSSDGFIVKLVKTGS